MASISLEEMRLYLGKSLSSVNQNKINGRAPFSHNPFLARVSDAYRTTLVPFASCVQVQSMMYWRICGAVPNRTWGWNTMRRE